MACNYQPANYTNYDYGVDITAPGGDQDRHRTNGGVLSCVPRAKSGNGKYYAFFQGTSMACPHVSGVAALGLSYAVKLGKKFTADEFRAMILTATNDLDPYLTGNVYFGNKYVNLADYKRKMGSGYIDAYKLLLQVEGTPYVTIARGQECEVDLEPYFGGGVQGVYGHFEVSVKSSESSAIGMEKREVVDGKLVVRCSKSGAATVEVSGYILRDANQSTTDVNKPYPAKVTKRFVIFSRESQAANGGWL